jgi:hypothetical protein
MYNPLIAKLSAHDNATGPIAYDSVPSWGGILGLWGSPWNGDDLIAWYSAMKSQYGAVEAKRRFSEAWTNRPISSAFGVAWKASEFDPNFISYFKSEGFSWDASGTIIMDTGQVAVSAANTASNTAKAVENITHSAANISSYILYVIIGIGIISGTIYLFIKFKK